ncbi:MULTISPECIES: hypothetical protein [Aerococcus]|uniref:Uncharacterized protein n=1 Tax=Aerococcus tenax TaxID=3078812 RepID=A0A329PH31_9LACT|nr:MULTISPECIES: hypothetical protein [Aerococcus]MDL5184720.1 hypothetical protein [Aerococcus mictus]KAA9238575.1 hypothetical protein F6I34_07990 [Aerococcus urinae]MDK6371996.1 hypothetical protein [Aerococcus urinae]MDK7302436.1 hypothetical protein [Aerococcus urinae]MDK7802295.1 hypothetical protein [Aerococcus urinae]
MIKGVTKTGFRYSFDERILKDFRTLRLFREVDKNPLYTPDLVDAILGKKQAEALVNHVAKRNGGFALDEKVGAELADILRNTKVKKS